MLLYTINIPGKGKYKQKIEAEVSQQWWSSMLWICTSCISVPVCSSSGTVWCYMLIPCWSMNLLEFCTLTKNHRSLEPNQNSSNQSEPYKYVTLKYILNITANRYLINLVKPQPTYFPWYLINNFTYIFIPLRCSYKISIQPSVTIL